MEFFIIIVWATVSLIIYQSHRQRKKIVWFTEKVDLTKKLAVVTGGSSGIGRYTALHLAKRKCNVIICSPDPSKGHEAVKWLKLNSKNDNIQHVSLNLKQMQSVRSAVHQISDYATDGVDILIHSAGVCMLPSEDTADGIEQTYQINHFGAHLMTELLMPLLGLRKGRVVFIGSKNANKAGTIELNSFNASGLSKKTNISRRIVSYFNSKLMNSVLTVGLSRQLKERNIPVTVNIAFPGLSQTDLFRHTSLTSQFLWNILGFMFSKYPDEAAQTVLYCATSAEMTGMSGRFISECRDREYIMPAIARDESFLMAFMEQSRSILRLN